MTEQAEFARREDETYTEFIKRRADMQSKFLMNISVETELISDQVSDQSNTN
jgi:hypothetical protein